MIQKFASIACVLLASTLVAVNGAWAQTGHIQDAPQTRIYFDNYVVHQTSTEDGIGINLLELMGTDGKAMADAPPVILVHGFTQNWNTWFSLGEELRKQGFRVFIPNWRGSGQGATQSLGLNGDRSVNDPRLVFDNLPAYDVPAIVDFVYKTSNQKKAIYLGHSMGSMMMHLALGGVSRGANGEMTVSEVRMRHLESELKAFISVGSPVNFAEYNGLKGAVIETFLSMSGINLDKSAPGLLRSTSLGAFAHKAHLDYLYHAGQIVNPLGGLLNLRNISRADYGIEKEYLGSDVPTVFLGSILNNRSYTSADGKVDYAKISMGEAGNRDYYPRVPTLLVSADNDALAPLADQLATVKNRDLPHLIYKDTGHVDLVIGRNVKNLALNVMHFSKIVHAECRDIFSGAR